MVMMSMSRFLMWAISWAMTPRSSSSLRRRRMPVVTATTAFLALRPVAKAFGESLSMTKTLGLGMLARRATSATMKCSRGSFSSDASVAWAMRRAMLPLNQKLKMFITAAMAKKMMAPHMPKSRAPAMTKRAVRMISKLKVLSQLIALAPLLAARSYFCRGGL